MMLRVSQYFWIEEFLYVVNQMGVKISIILLYLRTVAGTSRSFRMTCYVLIGLFLANIVAYVLALSLQCTPISYNWTQWTGETHGHCVNAQAQIYSASIINIIWDLVVFFLPIPKLAKLQVRDTRKKVMVIVTFLVGLFGTFCSIVRLKYLVQWGKLTDTDITLHYNDIALWSAIEGDVGVICACLPAITGLVLHYWRGYVSSRVTGSRSKLTTGLSSKGIQRLPGSDSHANPTRSGISKTVESHFYNVPMGDSRDDVELVSKPYGNPSNGEQRKVRVRESFGHEYAGGWR